MKALFIDQNIPYHDDSQRKGVAIEANEYYPLINKYLEKAEKEYGELTVALHPSPTSKPEQYPKFKCVRGRTKELIDEADIVLIQGGQLNDYVYEKKKKVVLLAFKPKGWYHYECFLKRTKMFNQDPVFIDG